MASVAARPDVDYYPWVTFMSAGPADVCATQVDLEGLARSSYELTAGAWSRKEGESLSRRIQRRGRIVNGADE